MKEIEGWKEEGLGEVTERHRMYGMEVTTHEGMTSELIIEECDFLIPKEQDLNRKAVYMTMDIIHRMRKILKDHCA